MEKVLINRNLWAESRFYNDSDKAVCVANEWIIPLMEKFGLPVSVEAIGTALMRDIREYFTDEIIRKRSGGKALMPGEQKQYQADAEKEFKAALDEVIKESAAMSLHETEYNKALADYQARINALNAKIAKSRLDGEIEACRHEISDINGFINRLEVNTRQNREQLAEDKKRAFDRIKGENYAMGAAVNFVKLDKGQLVYDKDAVSRAFAVYARNPKEVKLFDKVKQLADLINEVYGNQFYGPQSAFYRFFEVKDGRVVVSSEIRQESIALLSNNI